MSSDTPIARGSRVTLHLAIALEDGTEVQSTFGEEPLTFTVGDGTVVEGLEDYLIGMRPGEEARLALVPEDAFGERDPANVQEMPRTDFPLELSEQLRPGQIIAFRSPTGEDLPGTVVEVGTDRVEVDFNPPLAGRNIHMRVALLAVEPAG